jgi:hypothetical protein
VAGLPVPRRLLSPALRDYVRASGRPAWAIAEAAGFRHYPKFSALVNAETIPATQVTLARLYAIADCVGLDRALLFVEEPR